MVRSPHPAQHIKQGCKCIFKVLLKVTLPGSSQFLLAHRINPSGLTSSLQPKHNSHFKKGTRAPPKAFTPRAASLRGEGGSAESPAHPPCPHLHLPLELLPFPWSCSPSRVYFSVDLRAHEVSRGGFCVFSKVLFWSHKSHKIRQREHKLPAKATRDNRELRGIRQSLYFN